MKQMARRGVYSFVGFLILTYLVILRVYSIASGPQLAETAQQVVRLEIFAQYTFAESAVQLEIPEGTAKKKYYAALQILRKELS